ncbi:RICIN domain-containing protein [Kitasatospora gansuensis]
MLSTTKSGSTTFTDSVEYLNLGSGSAATSVDDAATAVTYNGSWSHATGESGPYAGTNSYSDTTGDTSTLSFVGTGVTLRAVTAPSHGIVGVSVDGGAEALVDLYSAARAATSRCGPALGWRPPRTPSGCASPVPSGPLPRTTGAPSTASRSPTSPWWARTTASSTASAASRSPWPRGDHGRRADRPEGGRRRLDHRRGPAGAYTLRYTGSGKALDVDGYSQTVGLPLQQWTSSGGTNQQWYLRPTGDGYFTIVSHDSGLVADVYNWDAGDNAKVVQYTSGSGANQQWQLVPA